MVGKGVEHDGRILSSLHDLVEVTDCPFAHGAGQRAVHPAGLPTFQQESADEIGSSEVVVARDGDQRPTQVIRHGFDEPRLPAPGRTLEDHRQALPTGRLEHLFLVADRKVERATCGGHHFPISISNLSLVRC